MPQVDFTIPAFGVFINFVLLVSTCAVLFYQVKNLVTDVKYLKDKCAELHTRITRIETILEISGFRGNECERKRKQ